MNIYHKSNYSLMDKDIKKEIGLNLQRARKSAGITQNQIAEELGMAQTQYSRYERGAVELDYQKIIFLCQRFDITPNDLFDI